MKGVGLGVALWLVAAGCLHAPGGPAIPLCPGGLRPTGEIEDGLRLRLRMRLRSADLDTALELAVEKRAGRLVVVGFDPLGVKSFSLVQRGLEVEVDALPPAALPTAPENVLRDLHRARFLALDPPASGEGTLRAELAGSRVSEGWSGGRLAWRRFEGDAGEVRLDFAEGSVSIDNPGCGYRATLVELAEDPSP